MLKYIAGLPRTFRGSILFLPSSENSHADFPAKRGALIWEHYCGCSNSMFPL